MQSWQALPETMLPVTGVTGALFLERGVSNFRAAGRYLHQFPYGRNTDRADFRSVLVEGRGTCSTKHALLAELAREQQIPVRLTLGIYEMHEHNTPGVGNVLDKYGLPFVLEAHCYLTYESVRIDVTRSGIEPTELILEFFHEETITPEQIGDYKVQLHQRFLREWLTSADFLRKRSFNEIWKIREECIAALAQ